MGLHPVVSGLSNTEFEACKTLGRYKSEPPFGPGYERFELRARSWGLWISGQVMSTLNFCFPVWNHDRHQDALNPLSASDQTLNTPYYWPSGHFVEQRLAERDFREGVREIGFKSVRLSWCSDKESMMCICVAMYNSQKNWSFERCFSFSKPDLAFWFPYENMEFSFFCEIRGLSSHWLAVFLTNRSLQKAKHGRAKKRTNPLGKPTKNATPLKKLTSSFANSDKSTKPTTGNHCNC